MSTSHPSLPDTQSPTVRLPADDPTRQTMVPSPDEVTPIVPAPGAPTGERPRTLRHYVLLRELGRGGMGIVYEAEDTVLHRHVAIKVLPPAIAANAELLARFRRESESAASLDHPGIVKVFGIGEDQGVPFYAMELVEGLSLDRMLEGAPLPSLSAARLARCVAEALAYAHRHNVIHRDIKPANLIVVGAKGRDLPEDLRVVVTDFGLARGMESSSLTKTGDVLGTPAYMSPEQASGAKTIDARADLYSLGATLYEMATGVKPFAGQATGEVLHRILQEDPTMPRIVNVRIPRDLETIILKLMEKEPSRRYARAEEVVEDLRRFLSEEPIRARPVSVAGRLYRKARKNKAATALVAILILSATLGPAAWLGVRWRRARDLERRVEAAERALLAGNPRHAFDLAGGVLAEDPDNARARLARDVADRSRREGDDLARARSLAEQAEAHRARGDEVWKHVVALRREAVGEADRDEAQMKALLAQGRREEKGARAEYSQALARYHEALGVAPSLSEAADRAAGIYQAYHTFAEETGAWEDAADLEVFLRGVVDRCGTFTRTRLSAYLDGGGQATVETDPPATLTLFRCEERDGKLVPVSQGAWPGGTVPLAWGSWVVVATAEGYVETRIPIWVPREGEAHVRVKLRKPDEIGDGFIHVPGGGFWMGGDDKAFGAGPRRWIDVPDFAISRFEVTAEEYCVFLNAVSAKDGWQVAQAMAPRATGNTGYYWVVDNSGAFSVPRSWDLRFPIYCVSRQDAEEYCLWLSERDAVTYHLPTETEWEKAARGVDGRPYPWGTEMVDGRCVVRTHPACAVNPNPQPIGLAPDDESPYGLRDAAGSVAEWTSSSAARDASLAIRRGASWGYEPETCRSASRIATDGRNCNPHVGFRVVRELK